MASTKWVVSLAASEGSTSNTAEVVLPVNAESMAARIGAGRKNLRQMDEILVVGRAVDPEHLASRGVDAQDVVARIDDDDADGQVEEQAIRRRRRLRHAPDVAVRDSDGLVELGLLAPTRAEHRGSHRWDRVAPGQPPIDAQARVLLFEWLRQGHDGLGRTEGQPAAGPQREREGLEGDPLHRRGEVDQHVPAEEEIDPREGRALAEIVLAEDHQGTQPFGDLVAAVRFHEVAVSSACGQALEGSRRIDPPAREGDRLAVDVRREDPDVRPRELLSEGFGNDDGQ